MFTKGHKLSTGPHKCSIEKDPYQQFIFLSRYAKWNETLGRRETWGEAIQRYINFFESRGESISLSTQNYLRSGLVLPSMRALSTAGPAATRSNASIYNCAALTCNYIDCFSETLYLLMNGCGVGPSCELSAIERLPKVGSHTYITPVMHMIQDSKEGWRDAVQAAVEAGYAGKAVYFNASLVRHVGARLRTGGGRASGPTPLLELLATIASTFAGAHGRKLTSVEVFDLMCDIAWVVHVGGVRRAALMILSSPEDEAMALAKTGEWWKAHPHRCMANISAVIREALGKDDFAAMWNQLRNSGSGERGIVNAMAMRRRARALGRPNAELVDYVINPCGEVILQPNQFCNLSTVVVRARDSVEKIASKVKAATELGLIQARCNDFSNVGQRWVDVAKSETILGVSLSGVMDNELTGYVRKKRARDGADPGIEPETPHDTKRRRRILSELHDAAANVAGAQGIKAVTTNKPDGNSGQLVNMASGIHARYAKYYWRGVRLDKNDPIYKLLMASGWASVIEDCEGSEATTAFVKFLRRSPRGSITRHDVTALQQLRLWQDYADCWADHNPSCTIYIAKGEWNEVRDWVWKHLDSIVGLSFLPKEESEHTYKQAPYQELSQAEYYAAKADWDKLPPVDWSRLGEFEREDQTTGTQTLACAGGSCEL